MAAGAHHRGLEGRLRASARPAAPRRSRYSSRMATGAPRTPRAAAARPGSLVLHQGPRSARAPRRRPGPEPCSSAATRSATALHDASGGSSGGHAQVARRRLAAHHARAPSGPRPGRPGRGAAHRARRAPPRRGGQGRHRPLQVGRGRHAAGACERRDERQVGERPGRRARRPRSWSVVTAPRMGTAPPVQAPGFAACPVYPPGETTRAAFGPASQSGGAGGRVHDPALPRPERRAAQAMPRVRQKNVLAAQWSPNGSIGTADLTAPGTGVFGANVFGPVAPAPAEDVFRACRPRSSWGSCSTSPTRRGDEGLGTEKGATHFTHWFQPLTGPRRSTTRSSAPGEDGARPVQRQGADQGRARRLELLTGGIRATFEARGYTAWDPTSPAFIIENPNGAVLCIPTAFASWTGRRSTPRSRCCAPWRPWNGRAARARPLRRPQHGGLHDDRARAGVLPDRRVLLRASRPREHRPHPLRRQAAQGHELDDHYFGSIPERVLACMLETELELAKLAPIKTRHNEVARGPVRDRPGLRGLERGHRPPAALHAGDADRGPPRMTWSAPREALRRRQRLGQAQQLVDGHRRGPEPPRPRRHAARQPVPVLRHRRDRRGPQAPGPAAGLHRGSRPGPPPRRERGAPGDHLDLPRGARGRLRRHRPGWPASAPPAS